MPDYSIKFNRLVGDNVTRESTPNGSGPCNPRFIVMHYTAGHTTESAVKTFKSRKSRASAHLIIGRDGAVVNMQAFNRVCWHAGPSSYKGFTSLNHHSIGIELVNPGFLRNVGPDEYEDWAGNRMAIPQEELMRCPHPKAGSGEFHWLYYTEAQLKALDEIVKLLLDAYPIIDIVGHEDIDTRGWKVDPGPAFPMMRYKALLDDRSDDNPNPYLPPKERGVVTARKLNVREAPGLHAPITNQLERNVNVVIFEEISGWFRIGASIEEGHLSGWVSADFVRRY